MFVLQNARGESVDINNDNLLAYTPTGLGTVFNNSYSQYENYFKNTKTQVNQGQMSIYIMFGDIESHSYQTFSQFATFLNYEPLTLVYSTDSGTWNRDARVSSLTKTEIGGTTVVQVDRLVETFAIDFINPWYNNKEGKYKSYDADPNLAKYGKGYFTSIGYTPTSRNYFIIKIASKGYLADNGVIGSAVNHDMTSDFISVIPGDNWIATGRYNSNASSAPEMVIVYQFYDANKAVLGARSRNSSGKYTTLYSVTKVVPSGAYYMRISSGWINDGYGSFKIEKGNVATDYTPSPEDDPTQVAQTWNYGYQEFIN
ncbi:phage baseplate protein [Leuconostoc suionicum]|nr:phage baseplate protein [Leuconostoc suionicum]